MHKLCEAIAGSRMYGLDTPESDIDVRGVFLNTTSDKILGLSNLDVFKEQKEDSLFFELRHFLKSLRKTNTQAIELLFAEDSSFSILTNEFSLIRKNRLSLISSHYLFDSLMGYIESEKRLANGERTGQLGGKRKAHLEKYGFSPKNFCHLLRLAYCGTEFFQSSNYPVNLSSQNKELRDFLFSIKTQPESYSKRQLNSFSADAIMRLSESFEKRNEDFHFDLKLANDFCLGFYFPHLLSEFGGKDALSTLERGRSSTS